MKTYYRGDVPYIKTTTTIMGQRQIDTWLALIALTGRRSNELASDMVLDAIRDQQEDPEVKTIMRGARRSRSGLLVVGND